MRTTIILIAVAIISSVGFSKTIYVPDDFPSLQRAIVSAVPGDTVIVRPGTYPEAIDFLGKAITVTGEHGAENTTIDGSTFQGSIVTCQSGEGPDSILDGFTIANGNAMHGAGMYNLQSSPMVTNCIFIQNTADYGGGMYNWENSPIIKCCTFEANNAYSSAGGMYNYESALTVEDSVFTHNIMGGMAVGALGIKNSTNSVTLTNCVFVGNTNKGGGGGIDQGIIHLTATNCEFIENTTSGYGGGISAVSKELAGSLTLTNCIFQRNTAQGCGGGLASSYNMTATNCTFTENEAAAGAGGGMWITKSSLSLTNSTFNNNAAVEGGGLFLTAFEGSTREISNSFFFKNTAERGGGVFVYYAFHSVFTNNTFVANSANDHGGAISQHAATTTMTNNIFWSNTAPRGPEIDLTLGSSETAVDISYSDVKGGQSSVYIGPESNFNWGLGMIDADPLFLDPLNDDYHLTYASPCIESGGNYAPFLPDLDFEGDPRIFPGNGKGYSVGSHSLEANVDMGADEYCLLKKQIFKQK